VARALSILFGTETFNAEGLAKRAHKALQKRGFASSVKDMEGLSPADLLNMGTILIITSTYGNGDPPANAELLHAALMRPDAQPMAGLRFSVCGLGDQTYQRFAQCGRDFDARLAELGAQRFANRMDCDVDYEEPFEEWLGKVITALEGLSWGESAPKADPSEVETVVVQRTSVLAGPRPRPEAEPGSRRNPISARIVENRPLTTPGASREVRHLRLAVGALNWAPGDAMALWVPNGPEVVQSVLESTGNLPDTPVRLGDEELRLGDALSLRLELTKVDPRLVELIHQEGGPDFASCPLRDPEHPAAEAQVVDLLSAAKVKLPAQTLTDCLRSLAPRLYSIASSKRVSGDEVDFCLSIVHYSAFGRSRWGQATGHLAERAPVGELLPLYLQRAPHFALEEGARLLMIGPGTGIAPFRGFLQDRAARGLRGDTWLVFGSRNATTDALYSEELRGWLADGTLQRLDLAWSRDGQHKVYVQDRLLESAAQVWEWIQGGAIVYVCGDAQHMAPDVHATLQRIAQDQGGLDETGAKAWIKGLAQSGRYRRDIY
jgi:sulfite reductase (NADPH) flavoprotein alpha-component